MKGLLEKYGVTSIAQLTHDLDISRHYGYNLWHARQGFGVPMIVKLHELYAIPYEELIAWANARPRRQVGRPRKIPVVAGDHPTPTT